MSIGVHGYKYDFFISYAEDSRAWVHGYLLRKLRRAGVNYLLEDDFDQNQPILKEREYAVENSWRTLLILTPRYLVSSDQEIIRLMGFTRRMMGKDQEYPVVPVIYKPIDAGLLLNVVGAVDLTAESEEIRKRELEKLLRKQGIKDSEEQERIEPPYPGMSPFQTHDNAIFFGRELETNQCADYLRANRLLVLTGVSGCGKSSLVKAGIIPRLQKSGEWSVKEVRPSMALGGDLGLLEFDALFPDLKEGRQPLLLVDQFEETFVADDKSETNGQRIGLSTKAKQFLEALSKVLDKAYIIITVRDEFYPQLAWCTQWIDIDPHLRRVDFIGRERLADAIRKPAASLGVHLDDVLVERLLNDAGDDPGILPFVQETMRRLWEQMEERYIDIRDYEALQGYGVAGLKYAIAAKADSAYKNLKTDEHRHIARRIFIRLVQFGEGKPDTRRQLPVAKLQADGDSPSVFEQTLQELSSDNNRLLTLSDRSGNGRTVDIVHESLIKAWPQFQEWLQEFREYDKQRRRLEFKADEWERLGGKQTGLLDAGELTEAKGLLNSPSAQLLGVENRFLTFLKQSELTIDPGWNQAGLISLLVLALSTTLLFGFAYLMSDKAESETAKSAIHLMIGVALMLVFGFFLLLGRKGEYTHKSKHYSHLFAKNSYILLSLSLLFLSAFLWLSLGVAEHDRQSYCQSKKFTKTKDKLEIAFAGETLENKMLADILIMQKNHVTTHIISNNDDLNKCKNSFDYVVSAKSKLDKNKNIYTIHLFDLEKGRDIPVPNVIDSKKNEICDSAVLMGYKLLTALNIRPTTIKFIKKNPDAPTSVSCIAFDLNRSAANANSDKNHEYATKLAKSALEDSTGYSPAEHTLGVAYMEMGEYDEAIRHFNNAIKVEENSHYYVSIATAYMRKKDFIKAESFLHKAKKEDNKEPEVYYGLNLLYLHWVQHDKEKIPLFFKSSRDFERSIKNDDPSLTAYWESAYFKNLSLFKYNNANYKEAIVYLEKALVAPAFEEEVVFFLAMCQQKLGKQEEACQYWKMYARTNTGDNFDGNKRKEEAKDHMKSCQ